MTQSNSNESSPSSVSKNAELALQAAIREQAGDILSGENLLKGFHEKDVSILLEVWKEIDVHQRLWIFQHLPRQDAEEIFLAIDAAYQMELLQELSLIEKRSWLRLLPPDDAADLIQTFPPDERETLLSLIDDQTRREVTALLAYAEDAAGGLMSPRYLRLRPEMAVDEALSYIRAQARTQVETIYEAYVLDSDQKLKGIISFRALISASPDKKVHEIMEKDFLTILETQDQEEISRIFSHSDLLAIPVVDEDCKMKGIITVDDIVGVVQEEATEDIQKMGAVEVLDAPYLKISLSQMIKKRAGWLTVLFVGEMFTATAMGFYEKEIERAVVLALFIPLIISSGGNSGSQATTLIIRSMALREIQIRDWFRVLRRELFVSLCLGAILGSIGLLRILIWPSREQVYGPHYGWVALTVASSLVGVVIWGTIAGSMLPFILRRLRFDPASSSAPVVATLVDVTGLIIYFSISSLFLRGILL